MTPNRVTTHPGEILAEEFLAPRGMSANALALALRVPANRIGAIVKAQRSVSADTALRLARFFGTTPEFWMNLQAMHDLTKTKMEHGAAIESDVKPTRRETCAGAPCRVTDRPRTKTHVRRASFLLVALSARAESGSL